MVYHIFRVKDSLDEIVDRYRISEVIISFRNMDRVARDSLKRECTTLGVNLSRLKVLID